MITAKELHKKADAAAQKIFKEREAKVEQYISEQIEPYLVQAAEKGCMRCQLPLTGLDEDDNALFQVLMTFNGYTVNVNSVGLAVITW